MKKHLVVGIGEVLWDMLPSGKRAGGAPVNFVYHAMQEGADAYAISAVGNDENGKELLAELNKKKIKALIQEVNRPTGTVDVKLINGIPTYKIVKNVAWDYIEISDEAIDLVKKCDVICFGTLALRQEKSGKTILSLIDCAPKDAFKFFDINLREKFYSLELIEILLQKANVLKINDIEMVILRQLFNLKGTDNEVCETLLKKYNLKYLIFTVGENYSIIFSEKDCTFVETPKVKVADTISAGDSFGAAFMQSILNGESQIDAHKNAVAAAAFVCTKIGAWPRYNKKKIKGIRDFL